MILKPDLQFTKIGRIAQRTEKTHAHKLQLRNKICSRSSFSISQKVEMLSTFEAHKSDFS